MRCFSGEKRQSRGWNLVVGATSLCLLVGVPFCTAVVLKAAYKSDCVASIQDKLPEVLKNDVLKPKINWLFNTPPINWLLTTIFGWHQTLKKQDSYFQKCPAFLKGHASRAWCFIIQKHNEISGAPISANELASTASNIIHAPAWKTFAGSISGFFNFFVARVKDFFDEDGLQKLNVDNLKTSRQEFVGAFLQRAAASHFEEGSEAAQKFVRVASGLKVWLEKVLPPNEESELFKNLDEVWGKWSNVSEGKFEFGLTKTRWWVNINFLNAVMTKNEVRAI
jgi:hypothetical protein